MEFPFFKAFPTDWEVVMMRAGIPATKRGDLYRLIFFAWQQGGLDLREDGLDSRMRIFAQGMGIKPCHFKKLIDLYKRIAEDRDGLWLPAFLIEQLEIAIASQRAKRKADKVGNAPAEAPETATDLPADGDELRRVEDKLERVGYGLSTSCARVGYELDTKIEVKSNAHNTPLALAGALAEAEERAAAEKPRAAEFLPDTLLLDRIENLVRERCLGNETVDQNLDKRIVQAVGSLNSIVTDFAEVQAFFDWRKVPPKIGYLVEDFLSWRQRQKPATAERAGVSDWQAKMYGLNRKPKTYSSN